MAFYLGDERLKINLNGNLYQLNIFSELLILNGILLISSERYILKDSNGVYLTTKESE